MPQLRECQLHTNSLFIRLRFLYSTGSYLSFILQFDKTTKLSERSHYIHAPLATESPIWFLGQKHMSKITE